MASAAGIPLLVMRLESGLISTSSAAKEERAIRQTLAVIKLRMRVFIRYEPKDEGRTTVVTDHGCPQSQRPTWVNPRNLRDLNEPLCPDTSSEFQAPHLRIESQSSRKKLNTLLSCSLIYHLQT